MVSMMIVQKIGRGLKEGVIYCKEVTLEEIQEPLRLCARIYLDRELFEKKSLKV